MPVLLDQTYKLGSEPLNIVYAPFKVLPFNYTAPTSTVEAYILATGAQLSTPIDLSCSCLTSVSQFPWITYDSSLNSIIVFSNDIALVGDYKIVLVQNFDS